jgi:GDPmannose 4,6-dehydratase
VSCSVRDFVSQVFGALDLDWRRYVETDPRYFRPAEVDHLEGDPGRARRLLGWEPRTSLPELVKMMVASDLRLAERERVLKEAGHPDVERKGYR